MTNSADSFAGKSRGTTPPYIPFRTFKTFLQDLDEHGIPGRVDNTALKRFSGGVARQLKTALRFMSLIEGDDRPTDDLKSLSDAFGGDQWQSALAGLLRAHYSPVMTRIDLATATPGELREAFKEGFDASSNEDVLRKSELFFLQAAQEAQIQISKRIPVVTRQRSPGAGSRRRSSRRPDSPKKGDETPSDRSPPPKREVEQSTHLAFRNQLLDKFPQFDPAWPDDLKTKWFEGFRTLMGMASETDDEPS